ncbi:hypothetical protein MARINOS108_11502 [Marinoscillum sp. 108]|nr:hypothetical protein MARINOS108_11502 [Marinoscillum sp. 108]
MDLYPSGKLIKNIFNIFGEWFLTIPFFYALPGQILRSGQEFDTQGGPGVRGTAALAALG